MRPIKFRVFIDGTMTYDVIVVSSDCILEILGIGDKLTSTYRSIKIKNPVMQFTGLLDKNGKEIWENDIFEFAEQEPIMGRSYVRYNKHTGCWGEVAWNHNFRPFYTYCVHGSTDGGGVVCSGIDTKRIIIVGNIYENGSLLNGKQ